MLRKIILVAALLMPANAYCAEWKIMSVSTKIHTRKSYDGPPEVSLQFSLKNISDRDIFIWGHTFGPDHHFYLIESFIQNSDDAAWTRRNTSMSGSIGRTGWIAIKPGQIIQKESVLFQRFVGRSMIFTFRQSYGKNNGTKGSEILLGPFKVPEPKPSEQEEAD
jgi:hypothetical protein